jgi:eukaryotic-like serine/threonine-protein kinase
VPVALGDYTIDQELGRGAMGVVFLARHRPTGSLRALKVLHVSLDETRLARFRREAEALARVKGAAVVPVHEVGFERGRAFFAMAHMPGGSLRDRLDAKGRLEWREVVTLGVALADALERCHEAGIIHRDLKPDNVLFDELGAPRLADFGIARDLEAQALTRTGAM